MLDEEQIRDTSLLHFFLAATLLLCIGCWGSHESEISGTVTLDGKPLNTGTVAFQGTASGATAYGEIGDNGSYRIRTGGTKGLSPGEYCVTVIAWDRTQPQTVPNVQRDAMGAQAPGKLLVPLRYIKPDTTDLRFTVKSGSNRIDIALRSDQL